MADLFRPTWSVLIPTYHCAEYLGQTLRSVLAQDPGPARMQIEVVDDCSTRDDPEAVVRQIDAERVSFFRQPRNLGLVGNFNTCIDRARGEMVHILHGDDLVDPGFYAAIDALAGRHPGLGLYATRARIMDAEGRDLRISDREPGLESPTRNVACLFYNNPLKTPSVVIRRSFYEEYGGFRQGLSHVADWELWTRAVACLGGVMQNCVLARYRHFSQNDTARLARSGENLRDMLRLAEILAAAHPEFDALRFRGIVRLIARRQITRFRELNDREAVSANRAILDTLKAVPVPLVHRVKELVASVPHLGRRIVDWKERLINGRLY